MERFPSSAPAVLLGLALAGGCGSDSGIKPLDTNDYQSDTSETTGDTDTDADADTDSDTDTDADSDADSDTDTDSDADADSDSDADSDADADLNETITTTAAQCETLLVGHPQSEVIEGVYADSDGTLPTVDASGVLTIPMTTSSTTEHEFACARDVDSANYYGAAAAHNATDLDLVIDLSSAGYDGNAAIVVQVGTLDTSDFATANFTGWARLAEDNSNVASPHVIDRGEVAY